MTWTYSLCCSLIWALLSFASLKIAAQGYEPKFLETHGKNSGWGSVIRLVLRTKDFHDSLPGPNSRCWPSSVELAPLYFSFLKTFYSAWMCSPVNSKGLLGVLRKCVITCFGSWYADTSQLQKYFGLNSLTFCDCRSVFLPSILACRKKMIICIYVFMYICTYTNIFIYTYMHVYVHAHVYMDRRLSSLHCDLPLSSPWPFAYSLSQSLLQWLFDAELFSASHFLVTDLKDKLFFLQWLLFPWLFLRLLH